MLNLNYLIMRFADFNFNFLKYFQNEIEIIVKQIKNVFQLKD